MLTKDDLKQIGEVMDDKFVKFEGRLVDRIVGDVGDMIEQNFLPAVDELMDGKLAPMKNDIIGIKAAMVTKSYLDEKMAGLRGDLVGYGRKLEKKTDVLVDTLVERRTLTALDLERLEQARVFPRVTQRQP